MSAVLDGQTLHKEESERTMPCCYYSAFPLSKSVRVDIFRHRSRAKQSRGKGDDKETKSWSNASTFTVGCVFSRAFLILLQFNMSLSISSRACFRLSVFPSFLADHLFALTFCLFRAICFPALSCWLCFSALASGYLFSLHLLAVCASSRANFRVVCFPALSCRLSFFPRYLAGFLCSRAFFPVTCLRALSCRLCVFPWYLAGFPRYLAGYMFPALSRRLGGYLLSHAVLPVMYLPALSCRLCIFPRFLAGYLFTRAFWRFRVMCFEQFLAGSVFSRASHWLWLF